MTILKTGLRCDCRMCMRWTVEADMIIIQVIHKDRAADLDFWNDPEETEDNQHVDQSYHFPQRHVPALGWHPGYKTQNYNYYDEQSK